MSNPDTATQNMIKNLEISSGRAMSEWTAVVRGTGLAKHGEQVAWLKSEHKLGHGYANLVAHLAKAETAAPISGAAAIDAWFEGDKAVVRPIYDAVIAAVGGDVEFAAKKTYMSVRRNKQFACVHPSTKTRLDLGLQLSPSSAVGIVG